MLIFIDESGSFQIPQSSDEHAAAVVVGIVVPEVSEKALFTAYASFVAALDKTERGRSGEPKGSRMSRASREQFSAMLAGIPGVMLLPITADLSELVGHAETLPAQMSQALQEFADICVHQTMRNQTMVLSRQIGNLSTQEFLKLLMFTECIQECVHHAVLYLSEPPYRDLCWNAFDISIDRLNQHSASREKQAFEVMLLSWSTAWSERNPLTLIKEIHTEDHPFIQRFSAGDKTDMRRLLGDGLHWVDSLNTPGVQIADIAAAITFSAVHDLKNHNNQLPPFLSLMKCCPYEPEDGPGFVTVLPATHDPSMQKYRGLVLALRARYPDRQWQYQGLRQMRRGVSVSRHQS